MTQIKKTLTLLRRSPYQALAAALAMSLTFFITSIFVVLILGGQIVLNYIEQRPELSIFFKDEATDTQINEVAELTKTTGFVKEIKFISKEEAYAIYKERFKDDPLLTESVTADTLPRSIQVSVIKPEGVIEVTNAAKGRPEVERVVSLSERAIENLTGTIRVLRLGGIIFVSTLTAISFLIIIMVIGMRIALRRDEISIMSLVGATRSYIAKPFFLEGALYGFIGATVATLLVYSLLLFYSPNIQEFLGPIQVFPISPLFFIYLWVGEVLVASLVGVAGASIALYRYLKI